MFYCLLWLSSALHKNNYLGCDGSARQGWLPPHYLNPSPQPPGQIGVAAGVSKDQYLWVEHLDNPGSVRSLLNHPVIQTPCCDRLFLVGHCWLNKSFSWSWQMLSPVPDSGAIGREEALEWEMKVSMGGWVQEEASLSEPCRPFQSCVSCLWPPKSWKAHLEAAQDREKSECSLCFHPLETRIVIPLDVLWGH